jgi:hypothetical protein
MRFPKGMLTVFFLAVVPATAQNIDPNDSAPFTSAIVCAQCHVDIHEAWTGNLHSRAATEPIFAQALEDAVKARGEDVRKLCLTCHAPTTVKTQDYSLTRNITKESVTCDFCHSMVDSHPGEAVPFELDVGGRENIKRGPYKDAEPDGSHGVAFSELHLSARLCASCHEYKTPDGVPILSTYSEYLEGPYPRRNVTCQGCHMPVVMANVVDPRVKRDPREFINLHRMPGGHAPDQLARAITLDWDEVRRASGTVRVRLLVSNTGSGHRVPTGMPSRKLVLEVEVETAGGKLYKDQAIYRKIVVDAEGREILRDGEMFTHAAGVRTDTRILPGEQRQAGFSFLIPSNERAELTARLVYEFSPLGPEGATERIIFKTIRQSLP